MGLYFAVLMRLRKTKFKALKIISSNKVSTGMEKLWGTT